MEEQLPLKAIALFANPVKWARDHPSFFFAGAEPSLGSLAQYMVEGAQALGVSETEVESLAGWTIVASTTDWFAKARYPIPESFEFQALTAFPELGDNCVRPEVPVAAFAAEVVVRGPAGARVVKGSASASEFMRQHLACNPRWSRAVAFRGVSA